MAGSAALAQETPVSGKGWEARLDLTFGRRGDRTLLARREHRGPLVVQKALHPEGPAVCQAVVVHPPGGIVGGDRLALTINVDAHAHAQLTTPGAAKWYRSAGAVARQSLEARVADGATLEWIPQETLVFDGAHASLATRIRLAGSASFIGFDVVCLGRTASGERFRCGSYRHGIELVRDGALIWAERAIVDAQDRLGASVVGLNGAAMFGTFVASATRVPDELLAACRGVATGGGEGFEGALTQLPGVLLGRCRGTSAQDARRWFTALWSVVRPALTGRNAVPPRIWAT